jgi:hypothetical protein
MNKSASENNIQSIVLKRKKMPTSLTLSLLNSDLNENLTNEECWFSTQSPNSISSYSLQREFELIKDMKNGQKTVFFRRKWKAIVYSLIFVIRLKKKFYLSKKNGNKLKSHFKHVKNYFSSSILTQSPIKFIDSMEKSDSSCNSSGCTPKSPKSKMNKSLSTTDLRETSSKVHNFPRTACEKFYKTMSEKRPLVKSSILKKLNLKSRNLKENLRTTIESLESIDETDSYFNENSIEKIIIQSNSSPQTQINVSSVMKVASINATPAVQRSNSMKRSISLCNLEYGEIERNRNNNNKMNASAFNFVKPLTASGPYLADSLVDSNFESTTNTENSSINFHSSNREQESAIFSDMNEQSQKLPYADISLTQFNSKPSVTEIKEITDLLTELLNRSISISESRSGSSLYDTVTKSDFTDVSKTSDLMQNSTLNSFNNDLHMAAEQFIKDDIECLSSNMNKDTMSILSDVIITSNLDTFTDSKINNNNRNGSNRPNSMTLDFRRDYMENEMAKSKAESILKATSIPMCLNLILNNEEEQQTKPLKSILLTKSNSNLRSLINDLKDSNKELMVERTSKITAENECSENNKRPPSLIENNKLKYQETKRPIHLIGYDASHVFLNETSQIPLNRCLMNELKSPDKETLFENETLDEIKSPNTMSLEENIDRQPTAVDSTNTPDTKMDDSSLSASTCFTNNNSVSTNFNSDMRKNLTKRKFQDKGSGYSYDDLFYLNTTNNNAKILTPRVRLFTINLANTIISNENACKNKNAYNDANASCDKTPLIIANFSKQQRKKETFTFYSNSNLTKNVRNFSQENGSTTSIPFLLNTQQQEQNSTIKRHRRNRSNRSIRKEKISENSVPNCVKCVQNFLTLSKSLLVSVCDYIRRK